MTSKTPITLLLLALTPLACDAGNDSKSGSNDPAGGKADDADGQDDLDPEAAAVYEDILGQSNPDH